MPRGGFGAISQDDCKHLEIWESQFDQQIASLESEQIRIRRHLHSHPEPSGEEIETSRFIANRLREAGFEPRLCHNGRGNETGLIADVTIGRPAPDCPLIAIRCDLDALRMPDEKKVEYASQHPGVAHACGHDAHAAILTGLALSGAALDGSQLQAGEGAGSRADFGMRLRLLFQPAEETSEGAQWLVDQGAMEGVDAAIGLHVDPERLAGQVGIRYGVLTANCDEVEILVEGHGGHAARPHHTIDPIATAAYLVNSLYKYLPRSVDSRNASVLTIGKISGGYASNVIPEQVELLGSLRTTDSATRETLKRRVDEIRKGVELSSGARIRVRFMSPLGGVVNDPRVTAAMEEASRRVIGQENIVLIDQPSMGGEDFSVYLEHVPGSLLRLGCASPGMDAPFLHSPLFDVDERALALGSRILFRTALLLTQMSAAD